MNSTDSAIQKSFPQSSTTCPYCGKSNFTHNQSGELNNFCGNCGQALNPEYQKDSCWVIANDAQELLQSLKFASTQEPHHKTRDAAQKFLSDIQGNYRFTKTDAYLIIPIYSPKFFSDSEE